MMSVDQLREAFGVYLAEMERCEKAGAYWALLHLVLVIPDMCGALDMGNDTKIGERYRSWCGTFLPIDVLTPRDRYQIRNALLHEGSTLPDTGQYKSLSFVDPRVIDHEVHQEVGDEGTNLTIDIKRYADEMREGLERWFASLQNDARKNALVESRLNRVARRQIKEMFVGLRTEDGDNIITEDGNRMGYGIKFPTTSSTGSIPIKKMK
jgi:hypothetical protein